MFVIHEIVCVVTIVFVVLIYTAWSLVIKNELDPTVQNAVSVREVVKRYFAYEKTLAMHMVETKNSALYVEIDYTIVLSSISGSNFKCINVLYPVDGFVILLKEARIGINEIIDFLECYNKPTWKLKTKSVLVIETRDKVEISDERYFSYLNHLWMDFGLVHVIYFPIYRTFSEVSQGLMFAYNPFVTSNKSIPGILLQLKPSQDFVSILRKRFGNMHGFPIKAALFPFKLSAHPSLMDSPKSIRGGTDLCFRWTVESHFNVSFLMIKPQDGIIHGSNVNGTPTGALADVINHRIEIVFNSFSVVWFNTDMIQFLVPRYQSSLVVVVGKKQRMQGLYVVFHVFSNHVWIGILLVFLINSVIYRTIASFYLKMTSQNKMQFSVYNSMTFFLKVSLLIPISKVPKSYSERILMAAFSWFSVFVTNVFFGQLFYLIGTKPILPNLKTLQELQDSNLPIITPNKWFLNQFDALQNTSLSKLKKRLTYKCFIYSRWDLCYPNRVKNFALLDSDTLLRYNLRFEPPQVTETFDLLQERVIGYYLSYIMPIGSIYYTHFNLFNARLVQYGFYRKWYNEYWSFVKEEENRTNSNYYSRKETNSTHLALSDLVIHFIVLFVGFGLSTISFAFELSYEKLKNIL